MKTVKLLPHTSTLRELRRKHGVFWHVERIMNMPCFNGDLGLQICSRDGKHKRNVRVSDVEKV